MHGPSVCEDGTCTRQVPEALAFEQLKAAASADPLDVNARVMFANVLASSELPNALQRGLLDQAQRYLDEALGLDPGDATVQFAQAKLCLVRGDPANAERAALRGLKMEPSHPVGHQILGIAAQTQGRTKAAGDHFVRAAKLDPRSSASTYLLRSLRKAGPLGGVALVILLWIAARILRLALRSGQLMPVIVAIALAVGLFVYQVALPRVRTRQELSDEARTALARNKKLRPWWRRHARKG